MTVNFITVALGGALGACCRYTVTNIVKKNIDSAFPFATFLINIVGSLILGLMFPVYKGSMVWLLAGTGFLGGFTTFSTFNVELAGLFEDRKYMTAWLYLAASYGLCILFAALGIMIGSTLG